MKTSRFWPFQFPKRMSTQTRLPNSRSSQQWVSGSNMSEAMALVAVWSNTQQFDCYAICESKETCVHGECYLYGHCTSNWLFIRIVSIQSHRNVLPVGVSRSFPCMCPMQTTVFSFISCLLVSSLLIHGSYTHGSHT